MEAYLIDTNVMLAASAIYNDLSNLADDAMPVEPKLRELIFKILEDFEESDDLLVLDEEGTILEEYNRNMPFNTGMHTQEYGLLVVQKKLDQNQVHFVPIEVVEANGERIATIGSDLESIVTDRADRKWVAAALSHRDWHELESPILYGAETDWFMIESALASHGIQLRRLLPPDWYTSRLPR